MQTHVAESDDQRPALRSALFSGVLVGVGIIGAADEIVFHQLLQWHNFYVHTDAYWRIFSDGVFHIFTAVMLFLAALRLWSQRRHLSTITASRPFWAGICLGVGGFQLFDGTVNHKLLGIHPVREGVNNLLPYDLAWNASALLLLLVGGLLWSAVRATERAQASRGRAQVQPGKR